MSCAICKYNDNRAYCSMPPMYYCTLDKQYYNGSHTCDKFQTDAVKPFVEPIAKKEYNCPDCVVDAPTCQGCQRYKANATQTYKSLTITTSPRNNDPCRNCPNDPRNGGSGICNCTIPYMNQWTTQTPYNNTITTTGMVINGVNCIDWTCESTSPEAHNRCGE